MGRLAGARRCAGCGRRAGRLASALHTVRPQRDRRRSRTADGRRRAASPECRPRHARHDAGGPHRRVRRAGRRDAGRSTRLAREGVLFEQAVAVAPLTLPAHSSIFTGRFPPEHGVRDNGGFFLDDAQVTLAEVLKERGYRTGGFVAAYVLDSKWGVSQGFDTYFDDFDLGQARGPVDRRHPAARRTRSWTRRCRGFTEAKRRAVLRVDSPLRPAHAVPPARAVATRYKGRPYNGEMAFVDSQVGRVIEQLRSSGLYDRTVVVVMGDHGESLGDHGEGQHGFFIYNSVTHVPFMIRAPYDRMRGPKGRRPGALGRRDADRARPARRADARRRSPGASLVPLMTGAAVELGLDAYSESMYPLHHYGWSDLRALRAGRYKVIDAPRPELYDIDDDPNEAANLYEQRRALGDSMLAQLRKREQGFEKTDAPLPAGDVDPEARARLAALGYVGSFVASASDSRTGGPTPRTRSASSTGSARRSTWRRKAKGKSRTTHRSPRPRRCSNEVVREDPTVIDAWFMLGTQHLKRHLAKEAVGYFKKTLEPQAGLRPRGHQHGPGVPATGRRRRGAGRVRAVPRARSQGRVRAVPDRRDLARPRRHREGRAGVPAGPRARSGVAAARNALGVIALERGRRRRRRAAHPRGARRQARPSGSRTSTWRSSPRSGATFRAPSASTSKN